MITVQVKTVRRSDVATVAEVAESGALLTRATVLAVKFPKHCAGAAKPGTVWRVSGNSTKRQYRRNGFTVNEELLEAANAEFVMPSGELLARWIHRNIEGVGEVIARRVVRALPNIDQVMRKRDMDSLTAISGVSEARAQSLMDNWPSECLYGVLRWLQDSGLPMGLADRLARVYGDRAIDRIKTDPFLLLAFGVDFERVMELAKTLQINLNDTRVLAGIAEHVAHRHCTQSGSTVITEEQLMAGAVRVLQAVPVDDIAQAVLNAGALIEVENGYQGIGAAVMERSVARFLAGIAKRKLGTGSLLAGWESHCNEGQIKKALADFEAALPFSMTAEQKAAVIGAVQAPVCAIIGGAGTGKTTILLALLGVYDALSEGLATFQVALSGRAAQRMAESTGRPATTIAKLISDHLGEDKPRLPEHLLLVIDESSMVDLLTMYKLIGILPVATRIVFVGDVHQLPPVGGGLIFHAVVDSALPVFHLSQVKRQGQDSGIHQLASTIRSGHFAAPPKALATLSASADCCYNPNDSLTEIERMWREAGRAERCIILTPTRKGQAGVDQVNQHLQASLGRDRLTIHYLDELRGWIPWITSKGTNLHLNDQVLVTANDYELDIRNGDLGVVAQVYAEPTEDGYLGLLSLDGNDVPITTELLPNLDLGYAITIHKSQGSQWPVCLLLIPGYATRMLDQTLVYTAVTRPSEQLVIVGDVNLIDSAVKRGSQALQRQTNLAALLPHS